MRGFLGKTKGQRIFNGIILLVVGVGIYLEFKPYIDTPNYRLNEVRQMDHKIQTVSPANVVDMLHGNERPVMLVVYASWCPICNKLMPKIVELLEAKQLEGVIPVFLSVDTQPRELSKYLVYHDYSKLFAPYMAESKIFDGLPAALQATGSHFSGKIPYVGFFDVQGKMRAESLGEIEPQTLLEKMDSVTGKQSKAPLL